MTHRDVSRNFVSVAQIDISIGMLVNRARLFGR
jgi:hypothetical protein